MIDVDEYEWDDDLYSECDMYRDGIFESSLNERFFAVVFGALVGVTLVFVIVSLGLSGCSDTGGSGGKSNDTELATVYDTAKEDDGILYESRGLCSECGREGCAINGDIVCRNEDCPNYGLAAPAIMSETEN